MSYTFNKPLFIVITIIIAVSITYIGFSQGLIKLQNNHIQMFREENLTCKHGTCEFILFNGSILKLEAGESILLNNYNHNVINILTITIWIIIIIGLITNHYLYNKDYNFKKKYKEIQKNMEEK